MSSTKTVASEIPKCKIVSISAQMKGVHEPSGIVPLQPAMILYATLSGSPPPPHRWWDSGGDPLRAPNNLCSYDGIPPEVLERLAGSGSGKTHGGSPGNKCRGERHARFALKFEATQCHVRAYNTH